MTYAEHIDMLCKAHNIKVVHSETRSADGFPEGFAYPSERVVVIPELDSGLDYLVALHEIGHVVTRTPTDRTLENEARAWQWALENNKFDINMDEWSPCFTAISSYVSRLIKRNLRGQAAFVPDANHWFWNVYCNILQRCTGKDFTSEYIREQVFTVIERKMRGA